MQIYLPHRRRHHGASGNGFLTGLLHWWDLDETSGNAIASAGGVDLTDTNTVTYTAGGAPDGGNSRLFTSASNERFASASTILSSGTTITFALWFKSSTGAGTRHICGHPAANGYTQIGVFGAAGSEYAQINFDATLSRRSPTNLIGTTWHSFIATSTGPAGTDTGYLDGTAITSSAANQGWEPGAATYYLGANYLNATGSTWAGEMASHGIWDRVFTAAEAVTWHNAGVNLRYADLTS